MTGTFLLNNRYAFVLFDTGADRSFVSTAFSSQMDITPSTLDHYYDVELADGRIISCVMKRERKAKNNLLMAIVPRSIWKIHGMMRQKRSGNQIRTSKSSTNKVKSSFTGAYSTCTPSTSSTNISEKEILADFADEVIYSLFAKQSEDWDLLHEDMNKLREMNLDI
ncbi:reverse transcriptase domain-containing protein [Tanacetum coccineum]